MQTNTAKSVHTTGYSTHYKASIQGGLLHALQGPSPKRIVSSTAQDVVYHRSEGITNSTIQSIKVPYICIFVKLFFDFSKHYYCDISRNIQFMLYRWKYGNVFLSNVFRFLRALTKRLIYSRLFAPPCRSKAKLGTCHSLASIYDQASPKLANNVILSAAKDDRAVLPCALWPTRAHVWLRLMPITSDTKGSYESCSCLLLQRIPPNIKVA